MRINSHVLLWSIAGALCVAGMLVLIVYLAPKGNTNLNGEFARVRSSLNVELRQALSSMGINPRERAVIESRDKMIDGDYSWSVLNWRVRIDPDFDLPYARRRLESTIRKLESRYTTSWNYDDNILPLKIEAYVEGRLSHRIFFTVEQPEAKDVKPVANFSSSRFIGNRWNILAGRRLELDKALQNSLASLSLSDPPLVISEYWSTQSPEIACWIVNLKEDENAGTIQHRLSESVPYGEITVSNLKLPPSVPLALDIKIDGIISHRIYFSTKPTGRGLRILSSKNKNEAVYIVPPRVALIIDDIGYDTEAAENLMSLGIPITLSILPHRPYSTEIALRAHQRKFETMLHMPMEPVAYPEADPGPGRILVKFNKSQIHNLATESIESVPYVTGVNNHMGSRAMGDAATVQAMLAAVKESGLYFVDSRTLGDTLGYTFARNLNIPTGERSVFLDSVDRSDVEYCSARLREVIRLAKAHGSCIAIGHPHKGTIEAIQHLIEEFGNEGIEFVFASDLVS